MCEIIPFPADPYRARVYETAKWLKGRERHLVEKLWRTELNRYQAALVCDAGVSTEEASERALLFGRHVLQRLDAIDTAARTSPPCVIKVLPCVEGGLREISDIDPQDVPSRRVTGATSHQAGAKP